MNAYKYIGKEIEVDGSYVRILKGIGGGYFMVIDLNTHETKYIKIDV